MDFKGVVAVLLSLAVVLARIVAELVAINEDA
jgi:hypothetical protein